MATHSISSAVGVRRWLPSVAALLMMGCAPDPEVTVAGVSLRSLPSCPVATGTPLRVRAAGDFPTREASDVSSERTTALEQFPIDTRELSIELQQASPAAGVRVAVDGRQSSAREALLLPLFESCPLGDPLARVAEGTALSALPGGGLLYAGGSDAGGAAVSSALWLSPGASLVEQVPGGMLLRRAHATATAAAGAVVVAGGASDARGPAHDTYERFDPVQGRFDPALSARLARPRRDHGAIALPDGAVLLVGGREDEQGAPLASLERIDPGGGDAVELDASLSSPRLRPRLSLALDGTLLVFGGVDGDGAPVAEVERLALGADRFETVVSIPTEGLLDVAALPGDRIAVLACDPGGACALHLLSLRGSSARLRRDAVPADVAAAAGLDGLTRARLLGLADGRLLVIARAAAGAAPRRAFLADVVDGDLRSLSASRVPDALALLDDGTLAEVDAFGTSLRRVALDGPLHDPPEPLLRRAVFADAPGDLQRDADGALMALRDGATLQLARARYADFTVELALQGEATLELFVDDGGESPRRVQIGAARVRVGDCDLPRGDGPDGPLRLGRRGDTLQVGDDGCPLGGLSGRVGLALSLAEDSRVTGLSITRD
ncbi:MAG: kelch repeat-containing protein [Myxococcales bacterium]|jgi:hypothetical protein